MEFASPKTGITRSVSGKTPKPTTSFIRPETESMFGGEAEHDGLKTSGTVAASVHHETHYKEVTIEAQEERGTIKTRSEVSCLVTY